MQPPPGYPQQPQGAPQGPQPYPQGPQPYPQQYPMQQGYYGPPPKRGMPGWAWALIIVGILLFCGVPILVLAAVPLITSNTREARRAEGEQLMGVAVDRARVYYARNGASPGRFSAIPDLYAGELDGIYYKVDDPITDVGGSSGRGFGGYGGSSKAKITCSPVQTQSDGRGTTEFDWAGGNKQMSWD